MIKHKKIIHLSLGPVNLSMMWGPRLTDKHRPIVWLYKEVPWLQLVQGIGLSTYHEARKQPFDSPISHLSIILPKEMTSCWKSRLFVKFNILRGQSALAWCSRLHKIIMLSWFRVYVNFIFVLLSIFVSCACAVVHHIFLAYARTSGMHQWYVQHISGKSRVNSNRHLRFSVYHPSILSCSRPSKHLGSGLRGPIY